MKTVDDAGQPVQQAVVDYRSPYYLEAPKVSEKRDD
jgi:hypothetical protein